MSGDEVALLKAERRALRRAYQQACKDWSELNPKVNALQHDVRERDTRIAELEAELERLRQGFYLETRDTEAELAQALGYKHDEDHGWLTGDHTTVTLAMEARRRIEELHAESERIREALKFYADEDNYMYDDPNVSSGGPTLFEDEGGALARAALRTEEGKK